MTGRIKIARQTARILEAPLAQNIQQYLIQEFNLFDIMLFLQQAKCKQQSINSVQYTENRRQLNPKKSQSQSLLFESPMICFQNFGSLKQIEWNTLQTTRFQDKKNAKKNTRSTARSKMGKQKQFVSQLQIQNQNNSNEFLNLIFIKSCERPASSPMIVQQLHNQQNLHSDKPLNQVHQYSSQLQVSRLPLLRKLSGKKQYIKTLHISKHFNLTSYQPAYTSLPSPQPSLFTRQTQMAPKNGDSTKSALAVTQLILPIPNILYIYNFKSQMKQTRPTVIYQSKHTSKNEPYYESYELGRQLGKGGFAQHRDIPPGTRAVKVINMKDKHGHIERSYVEKIHGQIKIMQFASKGTQNIVKYHHSFCQADTTYIMMQLCPHGSLGDMLKKRKTLSEPQVRYYLQQLVEILLQLRMKGIVHRDIKPANIMLAANLKLKLGDFGLAILEKEIHKVKSMCGTPNYLAPEVINKKEYSYEVDLWAVGVLTFTCLLGFAPFETKTCNETYERIKKCQYKFQVGRNSVKISQEAKLLINDILKLEPSQRIKLQEILFHPFLCSYDIPRSLEKEFIDEVPNSQFIKKYGQKKALSMQTVQNNSDTVEKRQSSAIKPLYRNCLQFKPEAPRAQMRFTRRKEKMEQVIQLDSSKSNRKRERNSPHHSPLPKKIFKKNCFRKDQDKNEQTTVNKVKVEEIQHRGPIKIQFNAVECTPIKIEVDPAHHLTFRANIPNNRSTPNQKQKINYSAFLKFKQEEQQKNMLKNAPPSIIWYHLRPNGDFLYNLSNGFFGAAFSDGTQALTSDFLTFRFNNANVEKQCQSRQLQQKREEMLHYMKEFKHKPAVKSQPLDQKQLIVLIKAYAFLENGVLFIFEDGSLQFKHDEGWKFLWGVDYAFLENKEQTWTIQRNSQGFYHPNEEILALCLQFNEMPYKVYESSWVSYKPDSTQQPLVKKISVFR